MINEILNSKIVNISEDDLGSQITFLESNEDNSNYFLIQKYYGDYEDDDNSCYVESSINHLTGFYNNITKILYDKSLEVKTDKFSIIINFDLQKLEYNKLKKVLKIIIG